MDLLNKCLKTELVTGKMCLQTFPLNTLNFGKDDYIEIDETVVLIEVLRSCKLSHLHMTPHI